MNGLPKKYTRDEYEIFVRFGIVFAKNFKMLNKIQKKSFKLPKNDILDYQEERSNIASLKNFVGINVNDNKNYRFSEEEIKIHLKYGIYFYDSFESMNKSENLANKLNRVLE